MRVQAPPSPLTNIINMTRKKENYDLWLREIKERHRIRNQKRREKRKIMKNSKRTWKPGCLVTFKTLDSCRKYVYFLCQMKKVPKGINLHSCCVCNMINHGVPCLNVRTDTHKKCYIKRPLGTYPLIIGRIDKYGNYHKRHISI